MSETNASKAGRIRKVHHTGRTSQIIIYLGKQLRFFINQSDWKVIPMAAVIAALVSMVIRKKFFVIADELSGSPAAASAELSFHLCDPVANVSIDDIGDTYGAHTTFADGNNMAFKTFCSASGTPGKESGESWYSNSIGQKTARRFYRVSAPKAAGEKLHFVTVIQPLGSASSFGSLQAEASFTGTGFAAEAMGIRFEAEF